MISNAERTRTLPVWKKSVKLIHQILVPLLWLPALVCTLLCCFKPAEGSNSRTICIIVAASCYLIIFGIKYLNKRFTDKEIAYRTFQNTTVSKLDLPNLIPLLALTVVIAIPFYLLLITSLKNPSEANAFQFTWWPREGIDLESYKEVFDANNAMGVTMGQAVINSFIYAIIPTVVGILSASVAAYAFSKLKFKGRDLMYSLLIMTMMMPGCVTMATSYLVYDRIGWTNYMMPLPLPLIVPGLFGTAACTMFLREFFMGIPDGLLEAAKIDGAGRWRTFIHIMLPLAKPALMAQFILGFITKFNDYMGPLIYLQNPEKYTVQIALNALNTGNADLAMLASAGVLALVPMLLLYVIFQKQIINGISISSGLKG